MNSITVACVQLCSGTSVEENIKEASTLIKSAAEAGATFIVTPENTSLLDCRPGELLKKTHSEDEDAALSAFRALAKELSVWILVGSLPIKVSEEKCANRSFCISPEGEIVERYDKIHMCDVQLSPTEIYKESDRYDAGNKMVLAKTSFGLVGMTICYDLRFSHLYRDLAKQGAEIIVVPAAFLKTTGIAHWHTLLKARAIETGCFIIAPAQAGAHEDGRETYGHSIVVSPWGEIIVEAGEEAGYITASIDLEEVHVTRKKIPSLIHDKVYLK
jgi:predicted amidohydrolase